MSTQTFSPEQVKELSQQYDLFDMEAYAVAQFCKMYDIPFYCLKAVSDNLDGSLKDWRSILADIRVQFTELLNSTDLLDEREGGRFIPQPQLSIQGPIRRTEKPTCL